MEFELQKMKLENEVSGCHNRSDANVNFKSRLDLHNLIPKFEMKDGDIVLFLSLFERQAKRVGVEKVNWVSALLTSLPSDITQLIARESEEKFDDYEYIKGILLKRFKLSPETFRQKFVKHQRNQTRSWRDFVFEITKYFEEWIEGLEIEDFDALKDLIIADQLKKRVPNEIKEHFMDDWVKLNVPSLLADKLDEYESIRANYKKTNPEDQKGKSFENSRPISPFKDKYASKNVNKNITPNFKKYTSPYSDRGGYKSAYKPPFRQTCYSCGGVGHTSKFCRARIHQGSRGVAEDAQSNAMQVKIVSEESKSDVLTARITVPGNVKGKRCDVDELQCVNVRCGGKSVRAIIDTGAQVSVIREDIVKDILGEGEGKIKITSAFGETESAVLKIFKMRIEDGVHGDVPIACAVSRKLINDMLICSTAYEMLCDQIELISVTDKYLATGNVRRNSYNKDLINDDDDRGKFHIDEVTSDGDVGRAVARQGDWGGVKRFSADCTRPHYWLWAISI